MFAKRPLSITRLLYSDDNLRAQTEIVKPKWTLLASFTVNRIARFGSWSVDTMLNGEIPVPLMVYCVFRFAEKQRANTRYPIINVNRYFRIRNMHHPLFETLPVIEIDCRKKSGSDSETTVDSIIIFKGFPNKKPTDVIFGRRNTCVFVLHNGVGLLKDDF